MGRRASVRAVAALVVASGCNALTGVDDLERVDGVNPNPVALPEAAASDWGNDARVYELGDASADVSFEGAFDAGGIYTGGIDAGDAGGTDARPSLCSGLTVLWRFDGKATSAQGDAPTNNAVNIGYGPGKFGQAIAVPDNQHVEYSAQRGGQPLILPAQGTVSMWVQAGDWSYPCSGGPYHTFFALDQDDLYLSCQPKGGLQPQDGLGIWLNGPNTWVNTWIGPQGGWASGFNHLAATWSQSTPQTSIVLNASVANTTTAAWTPVHPTATTFFLSFPNEPAGAYLDDVAVWTRPLSGSEIDALDGANKSVGDMCGLP
jgi:hypothetical protein